MTLHPVAPTLHSRRLVLRAHRADDLDSCCRLWADPEVVRHIGGRPFSREEVWSRILRYRGHWALLGYGYWLIEDLAGGFVGEVGYVDYKRDVIPALPGPELGFALVPPAHRAGLATEAAMAARDWIEQTIRPRITACLIDPDHAASLRVAEKCGYGDAVSASYRGQPSLVLSRRSAASVGEPV